MDAKQRQSGAQRVVRAIPPDESLEVMLISMVEKLMKVLSIADLQPGSAHRKLDFQGRQKLVMLMHKSKDDLESYIGNYTLVRLFFLNLSAVSV